MDDRALELMLLNPVQIAHLCGSDKLTEAVHGRWIRQMLADKGDMTLLAHRGSYKSTCLSYAIALRLILYPRQNILLLRKTDGDVAELVRQVKLILGSDPVKELSRRVWGKPVSISRADQFSLTTSCYAAPRGASQLHAQGIRASLTGKHADVIITDDIVNLQDRISATERDFTRSIYRELQNIRIPGGRIINTGTPWHPDDAIALMPHPQKWDWKRTKLLSRHQADALRRTMTPALFAANYELKHVAEEDALFTGEIRWTTDTALLRGGICHVDAAYGGGDFTALTCGRLTPEGPVLYGRLWRAHVEDVLEEIIAECDRLGCCPMYVERNADRGYLAREIRSRGFPVRAYHERENKALKISTHLYKWWPQLRFLAGTDAGYLAQITAYQVNAMHDDAPDSAACALRVVG